MNRAAERLLLSCLDVGVVRVRIDHPGYIALWVGHYIRSEPVRGDNVKRDVRLTPAGRRYAESIPRHD